MKTTKLVKLFALITVFTLLFAACGAKEEPASTPPATQAVAELGLTDWTMDASIWSSSNGASIDLTATPIAYAEGMTANFVVRLEGEDVSNNPCEWNGTAFTSFADLNAEDGYCYYVILTGADGESVTVEINTPNTPKDESLISLASSLESYCTCAISDAPYADETLTISQGSATIQPPRISTGGKAVTCTEARLILNLDGGALALEKLEIPAEPNADGSYTFDLTGISFKVPNMEGDHQLTLALAAELSNGQTLEDESSTSWFYSDGNVSLTVG